MFDCVGPSGGGGVEGRSVLSSIRHGVPAIGLGMGAGDAGVGENAQLLQNGQGVGGLGGEGDGHRAAPVHHAVLLRQVEAEVQVSLTGVLQAVLVLKKVAGADGARVEIGQHGLPQLLRLGGADGVAAYGVIMYVSFIFAAIFIGYAQGCAPVVSYHYGADNTDELKNLLRISLRVIAVGGVAMLCFSELLAAPLSRFFVGYDAELLELTTLGMKLYSLSFLLCGFNIFGSAFFTALNNGIVSAVISFLRTLVFQVTAILVLPHLLGMNGIWLSVVAAEIAALFVNAFFLVKNRKKCQY